MSDQHDEKRKRTNVEGEVEWSFDFAQLGESLKNMANSLAGEEELTESSFQVEKTGVQSAQVKINFSAGKNIIEATEADSAYLLDAHLQHVGEVQLLDNGVENKQITLKQVSKPRDLATPIKQGLRMVANNKAIEWRVKLSPDVPLSLDINGGVGPSRIDLTGLTVRHLDCDAGVGQFIVILPEQDDELDVDIDTGVGETKIYLPENVSANLEIDAGVGSVDVTIPPNSAVQIRASSGIGSINVPSSLRKLEKKGDKTVWQSEGFDLAERRIVIRYSGGIGAFFVREAELM
ncbi:MAG: hypothetical protein ACFE0Q_01850 [Anaerolineae bacterium]